MTSPTDSLGTRLNGGGSERASLEEAMARHEARQRWSRPIVWTIGLLVVTGVLAGVMFGVFFYSRSLSNPTGDPHGEVLHGLVKQVYEHVPLGAVVVSHRYSEPHWYNCSPRYGAHFSDVQAQVVFRSIAIPAVVAQSAEALTAAGQTALSWSTTFQVAGKASAQLTINDNVSVHWKMILGSNARVWTFDASAPSLGTPSGYCSGRS